MTADEEREEGHPAEAGGSTAAAASAPATPQQAWGLARSHSTPPEAEAGPSSSRLPAGPAAGPAAPAGAAAGLEGGKGLWQDMALLGGLVAASSDYGLDVMAL